MADRRNPSLGSTDWAAKQFLHILEREEREKAARRSGVQTAQAETEDSFIPPIPPQKPLPQADSGDDTSAALPSWRRDPRATRIIEEILSWEGGESNRPTDSGGHTMRGITAGTLQAWHRNHPGNAGSGLGQIPSIVGELTADHALRILKDDVYDAYKLGRIADEHLAHQLTEILTQASPRGQRGSRGGAYQIIQRAANDVMTQNNLYSRRNLPFSYDHPADPLGPRTLSRLNWLVANGHGPDLRNALVAHRFGYARSQPSYSSDHPGWNDRFGRFTEWQHTPIGEFE